MTAAARARRRRNLHDLEIVVFERGPYTSYSACGIPYFVGEMVTDIDELVARSPEEHRRNGIDVRTDHEVVAIDAEGRRVRVRDAADAGRAGRAEPFDQLVVATGSVPTRPDVPGADAAGIFGVQTLADGVAVRRAVDEGALRRAVVVGGGYVGLEMAEALVRRGLEVALVDRTEQPMAATLDHDMGALVADALRAVGVSLYLGEAVEGFDVANGSVRAVRTASRTLPADIVVLGLGVRPNSAARERSRHPSRHEGRHRHRPAHGDRHRRDLGGGGLCRIRGPDHRSAPRSRARHAREQAGSGRGDQCHRRRRTLPRRGRHRRVEDLRLRGRPHRAHRARGRRAGHRRRRGHDRVHHSGGLLPGGGADHGEGRGRAG